MSIRSFIAITAFAASLAILPGCLMTKLVSVPIRVGGAVVSIIPVAGNSMHDAMDETADIIDEVPL